jgi:hypothetical protein
MAQKRPVVVPSVNTSAETLNNEADKMEAMFAALLEEHTEKPAVQSGGNNRALTKSTPNLQMPLTPRAMANVTAIRDATRTNPPNGNNRGVSPRRVTADSANNSSVMAARNATAAANSGEPPRTEGSVMEKIRLLRQQQLQQAIQQQQQQQQVLVDSQASRYNIVIPQDPLQQRSVTRAMPTTAPDTEDTASSSSSGGGGDKPVSDTPARSLSGPKLNSRVDQTQRPLSGKQNGGLISPRRHTTDTATGSQVSPRRIEPFEDSVMIQALPQPLVRGSNGATTTAQHQIQRVTKALKETLDTTNIGNALSNAGAVASSALGKAISASTSSASTVPLTRTISSPMQQQRQLITAMNTAQQRSMTPLALTAGEKQPQPQPSSPRELQRSPRQLQLQVQPQPQPQQSSTSTAAADIQALQQTVSQLQQSVMQLQHTVSQQQRLLVLQQQQIKQIGNVVALRSQQASPQSQPSPQSRPQTPPPQWMVQQPQPQPQQPCQITEPIKHERILLRSTSNARFLNMFVGEKQQIPVDDEASGSSEEEARALEEAYVQSGSSGSSGEYEEEDGEEYDEYSSGSEVTGDEDDEEYAQYRQQYHLLLEERQRQKQQQSPQRSELIQELVQRQQQQPQTPKRRSVKGFKVSTPHTARSSRFVIAPKDKILRHGMAAFRNCENGIVSMMRDDLDSEEINICFACGKRFAAGTKLFMTHSKRQKTGFAELDDSNTGHYIQHLVPTDLRHNYQGHDECYIYRVIRSCVRCFNQYNNNVVQDKKLGRVTIVHLIPQATTFFLMPEDVDQYY